MLVCLRIGVRLIGEGVLLMFSVRCSGIGMLLLKW